MSKERAFCTQAGKTVRLIPDELETDARVSIPPGETAICLDMNRRCTTARCPVTQAPTGDMALRLVRSGVAGPIEPAVARCPECKRDTVHDVVAWAQAICRDCGSVRRWSEIAQLPLASQKSSENGG